MEIRPGSGWFGVPTMIVVFALFAFKEHIVVVLVAIPVLYLIIGAVVWYGKRRSEH